VPATRIVLIDLEPALMAGMRAAAAAADDLSVIGEETEEVPLLVRADEADVVITGRPGEAAAAMAERLLDENPSLAVVAVDPTAVRCRVYRLTPSIEDVALSGAEDLVAVARRVGEQIRSWTEDVRTRQTQASRERA
jgi:DNA-binding NarL/FixJ family response regulator